MDRPAPIPEAAAPTQIRLIGLHHRRCASISAVLTATGKESNDRLNPLPESVHDSGNGSLMLLSTPLFRLRDSSLFPIPEVENSRLRVKRASRLLSSPAKDQTKKCIRTSTVESTTLMANRLKCRLHSMLVRAACLISTWEF